MWGLWFFPLVRSCFYIGAALAVLWYVLRVLTGKPPRFSVAAAVVVSTPVGCAALPVITLALLAAVSSLFQKSDTQLYKEIFGHEPPLTEDRMLFDNFGRGEDREIFMRAQPTGAEHAKMFAAAPLRASALSRNEFAELGARHSFSWWIATNPQPDDDCKSPRIREAHGFRGWREFRIAECLDGNPNLPPHMRMSHVYVVASGRP